MWHNPEDHIMKIDYTLNLKSPKQEKAEMKEVSSNIYLSAWNILIEKSTKYNYNRLSGCDV